MENTVNDTIEKTNEKISVTQKKKYIIPVIILNMIGIVVMIIFMLMFFSFNTEFVNPNGPVFVSIYEIGGFALVAGIIPMAVANLMMFLWLRKKHKVLSVLAFLPLLICASCGIYYITADIEATVAPKAEENEVVITLDFRCDEDIYGIFTQKFDSEGNFLGAQFGCNANYSPLRSGDPMYIHLEKGMDIPDTIQDSSDLHIKIFAITDKDTAIKISQDINYNSPTSDGIYEIGDGIDVKVSFGTCFNYIVKGNSKDGLTYSPAEAA